MTGARVMLYYLRKSKYAKEYDALFDKLVPESGQADTVQGELLRAIVRLASECFRNGNMNWDDGFDVFVDFLWNHLPDPAIFDSVTIEEINEDLGQLGPGTEEMDFDEDNQDFFDRIIN